MLAAWRRLPILVRAVIQGSLVAVAGTLPWAALSSMNLRLSPAVPWSVPVMALYLIGYWGFLSGRGWPAGTAEARREGLRAHRLSSHAWRWALLTGGLGSAGLVALRLVLDALFELPLGSLPDVSALPPVTVTAYVLTVALVAGVAEEAGFRGYMQGPIERRHGPLVAILATGCLFWLAHASHYAGNARPFLLHGWFYLGASALYGFIAYRTGSIQPCIVLHAAADVAGILLLGWLVSAGRGLDAPALLRASSAAALVLLTLALFAGRRLGRTRRGVEREFKLRIPSEEKLHALAARLGGASSTPVRQTNHFFDTRSGTLRGARLALRLREEEGRCTLALKGPLLEGPARLAVRPEEEVAVSPDVARELVTGKRSALEVLGSGPVSGSALVARARALVGSEPLRHLGAFENERLRIGPLAFPPGPASARLVFELDRTHFPGGTTERELEVELPEDAQAGEVQRALEELLAELCIPVESAPSKAERFFRSLGSDADRGQGTAPTDL